MHLCLRRIQSVALFRRNVTFVEVVALWLAVGIGTKKPIPQVCATGLKKVFLTRLSSRVQYTHFDGLL